MNSFLGALPPSPHPLFKKSGAKIIKKIARSAIFKKVFVNFFQKVVGCGVKPHDFNVRAIVVRFCFGGDLA